MYSRRRSGGGVEGPHRGFTLRARPGGAWEPRRRPRGLVGLGPGHPAPKPTAKAAVTFAAGRVRKCDRAPFHGRTPARQAAVFHNLLALSCRGHPVVAVRGGSCYGPVTRPRSDDTAPALDPSTSTSPPRPLDFRPSPRAVLDGEGPALVPAPARVGQPVLRSRRPPPAFSPS